MTHPSEDSLAGLLEEMLMRNHDEQITILFLVCKNSIKQVIESNSSGFSNEIWRSNDSGTIFSMKIGRKPRRNSPASALGNVLIVQSSHEQIYYAITNESRKFVESILRPFFKGYYPSISGAFLSSDELEDILEQLETVTESEVLLDRMTAYRRISYQRLFLDKASNKKKARKVERKESAVFYAERPYKEAFADAIANDRWVDKIQFHLISKGELALEGYISRKGLLKARRGFLPFYTVIFPYIVEIIQKKFNLYSNRARVPSKPKPSPLVVEFDYDIFKEVIQNHRFIELMKQMKFSSISVYHSNPYVHLSLVDYLDGSSFDLWVLSPNRLTVVPQLRASEASIARLMNHIFERFREGQIKDYSEMQYARQ
ncbi:hypothetical protein [Candidatus Nitrososphaera gargensis]|nr:hypothetical protein [Candidatus Nitrososphaera gargensis]